MQHGRACARQAGDDDRRLDRDLQNFRVPLDAFLGHQLVGQDAHDSAADNHVTHWIELSLTIDRIDQHLERLEESPVTEVVEPHFPACVGKHRLHRNRLPADA